MVFLGIVSFLIQIAVSIKNREALADTTGDPWNGRTLEWATSSPPPSYNFAFTPVVHGIDAWWDMKQHGYVRPLEGFKPIHMPKNTAAGLILAGFATVFGFCDGLAYLVVGDREFCRGDRDRHRAHVQLSPQLLHSGGRSHPYGRRTHPSSLGGGLTHEPCDRDSRFGHEATHLLRR